MAQDRPRISKVRYPGLVDKGGYAVALVGRSAYLNYSILLYLSIRSRYCAPTYWLTPQCKTTLIALGNPPSASRIAALVKLKARPPSAARSLMRDSVSCFIIPTLLTLP